jgi:hypothetical protein
MLWVSSNVLHAYLFVLYGLHALFSSSTLKSSPTPELAKPTFVKHNRWFHDTVVHLRELDSMSYETISKIGRTSCTLILPDDLLNSLQMGMQIAMFNKLLLHTWQT